jgi:hypothetical protein
VWCELQRAHTLAVTTNHVVFTLPQSLNPWVELHPEVIYEELLKSAWGDAGSLCRRPQTARR